MGKNKIPTAETPAPRGANCLMVVEWSEEDGCFVGSAPPIIGPTCHGSDKVEVTKHLAEIVEEWLAIMERGSSPAPTPAAQPKTR